MLASLLQEERLRYYLDEGLTSVPRFGSPTTAPAFSVSSRVGPRYPDSGFSYLGLGCPVPEPIVDLESETSICSLCAVRLGTDAAGDEEYEATLEGSCRDTRKFYLRLSITTFLFSVSSRSFFECFSSRGHPRQEEAEEDKSTCAST
jgi:hypothetical protein